MKVIKRIVSLGVAFVNVLCMNGYSKSCFTSLEGHRKWPIKRPGRLFRKKSFGWELFWTGCLRLGRVQKNKYKNNKRSQISKFFTKITKFLPKLITKILLFFLLLLTGHSITPYTLNRSFTDALSKKASFDGSTFVKENCRINQVIIFDEGSLRKNFIWASASI